VLYSARVIPFKGSWIEFATGYPQRDVRLQSTGRRSFPSPPSLRAIGFESDKDILEIFDLAEEVKANKTNLKKVIGRKLAARVLEVVGWRTSWTRIPVR